MKIRFHHILLFSLFSIPLLSTAQTTLRLRNCIETAVENNLQAQLSSNSINSAEITLLQKKFDFLPSVNANLPINKSFGKSADIYTQQIAISPWTSNPSLIASFTAFKGLSKWSGLKNAEYSLMASQYSLEDLKNDIRINTALAFFQVVFAGENLKIARNRKEVLTKQLEKAQFQFEAGAVTEGDVYTVKAQVATEAVNVISQENAYNRALLDLVLSMNLDPAVSYEVEAPILMEFEGEQTIPSITSVFDEAKMSNPGIRKQEFQALAAKYAINTARASFMPTVNINFGMGSFYSSNARDRVGYGLDADGFPQIIYGDTKPILAQLETNFSQSMSISLNIPIFNRYLNRQSYLNSKLNYKNALLNVEITQNDLFKSIQQAHLDARAAMAKYEATEIQLESLNESFRYAEAKQNAGMLDFYTFIDILNNKTKAEVDLVQARYDFVLKRKILDLYQGKELSF